MLLALVEASAAEALGLRGYRDEIEAALVPLNRAAARRVLSRQLRDLQRPKREGQEQARLDPEGADADLDALLGYEAPPKPVPKPAATAGGAAGDEANEGPSSGSVAESEVPVSQEPQVPQAHEGQGAPEEARRSPGDQRLERSREPDLEGVLERSAPRRGATLLWVVLVVALLAAGAFFAAPQMFGG